MMPCIKALMCIIVMNNMDSKNKQKYKNAILYLAKNLPPSKLGKTKLAKLLYYLDFISYRDNKKNVTGSLYFKQDFGPLAKDLTETISELVTEKKLEVNSVSRSNGEGKKDQYKALMAPDEAVFNDYEQTLLRKLVNKYTNTSTDVIVAKTHLEAPWVKAVNGTALDYKFAFDIEDFNPEIEAEARQEDEKIVAAVKSELAKTNC